MPSALVDGRRIAWREGGTGEPALLLHCGLAHSGAFIGLMTELGDRLAMRALDLPGHGQTERDPVIGMQAQAVADACALLVSSGPAHLIGHSFGATVAIRLAVEAPALVRTLTLIEPVMFGFLADAGDPAYGREISDQAPFRRAAEAGDWRRAAEAFVARWGRPGDHSAALWDYMLTRMPVIAESEREILDHPERRLHLDDFVGFDAPVLLVSGAESPPVIAAILDAIAGRLPLARRVVVPGAGHMVPVSHPGAVAAAIRGLVGRADASRP